jgi:large conductance mechanosensitive channel
MLSEFKKFILRGNVVDLAVAVVIGAAFGAVVTSLVKNLITPLIAAIGGNPDFSDLSFTLNNAQFNYGTFLNDLISFLLIAAVIFFLIIRPLNALFARLSRGEEVDPEPATQHCPECISEIPIAATRCAFCAVPIKASKSK